MSLQQCSGNKEAFNTLLKLERELCLTKIVNTCPLMIYQGKKIEIIKEIIRVIEFFLQATGRELEDFQIQILAGDLYERLQNDTLEDVIMLFKMARQGKFGKVYKLDVFEVMEWVNKYLEIKAEEREKVLRAKNREPRNESQEPSSEGKFFHELPQELQDKFNKIGGKVSEFIPKKATEILDREKFLRNLDNEGKKKKPIKFKKYI